jgi:hypothetical protein
MSSQAKVDWQKELIFDHPENNVSPYIANLVGRDLHLNKDHPLGIIKDKIEGVRSYVCVCVCACVYALMYVFAYVYVLCVCVFRLRVHVCVSVFCLAFVTYVCFS